MADRFQLSEVEGYGTATDGNAAARPGLSVAVHDTAYLGKVVANFRSEDFTRRVGPWIARSMAREAAQAECDRLNAKHGPADAA